MNENQLGALLEEIKDQNKAVLEAVGEMKDNVTRIPDIHEDVAKLTQDVKTVKEVV